MKSFKIELSHFEFPDLEYMHSLPVKFCRISAFDFCVLVARAFIWACTAVSLGGGAEQFSALMWLQPGGIDDKPPSS